MRLGDLRRCACVPWLSLLLIAVSPAREPAPIYSASVPFSSVAVNFDPTQYAQVVASLCPALSPQQALALLGLSGNVYLGHMLARGIELTDGSV